jgi:hypothetical protein
MDTHADTCVLGPNFVILHFTGRECDVSPYTEVYESVKAVPIVSGATAWTDEETGLTYILVINDGLWMPSTVQASLINPNQLRAHGITVQDNPFAGPMSICNEGDEDALCIPMFATGTNICVKTRTPTQEELDSCTHIQLTSDREWEPNDIKFPQIGAICRDAFMDLESVPGETSWDFHNAWSRVVESKPCLSKVLQQLSVTYRLFQHSRPKSGVRMCHRNNSLSNG